MTDKLSFRPEVADELAKFADKPYFQTLFDDVAQHRYYLKRHKLTGRLFNPVVNLPSRRCHLRQHLLFDGEPTVEIDVSCAQPSLFVCFYPAESLERLHYIEAIKCDKIYQFAVERLSLDRDTAKIEFLKQCAYGPIQANYPLFEVFCEVWPELGAIITEKRLKLGPSRFSCEMQRHEADIVIGKVLPDCAQEGLTVLPIHDAILCKESEAEKAKVIMLRHWTKALGFVPVVKCKGWTLSRQQAA